jgi:hypothetical protein
MVAFSRFRPSHIETPDFQAICSEIFENAGFLGEIGGVPI